MSRRKQSNPKSLLKHLSEQNVRLPSPAEVAEPCSLTTLTCSAEPGREHSHSTSPVSCSPAPQPAPAAHVSVAASPTAPATVLDAPSSVGSDGRPPDEVAEPATPECRPGDPAAASPVPATSNCMSSSTTTPATTAAVTVLVKTEPVTDVMPSTSKLLVLSPSQTARSMVCSCGISFSSVSTLSAHQKFYCTNRAGNTSSSSSDRSSVPIENGTTLSSSSAAETGKQTDSQARAAVSPERTNFPCGRCSFVADKLSALSRHMRVHSPLPLPQHSAGERERVEERFCTSCDIQFSSLNTFLVHKQHYCQTRLGKRSPLAAADEDHSHPQLELPSAHQLFILPTDPPVVVPLQAIQSASPAPRSVLTAPVHSPMCAQVILPDGSVQSVSELINTEAQQLKNTQAAARKSSESESSLHTSSRPLQLPFFPFDSGAHRTLPWTESARHCVKDLCQDLPLDLTRKRKRATPSVDEACSSKAKLSRSNSCDDDKKSVTFSKEEIDLRQVPSRGSEDRHSGAGSKSPETLPRICVKPLSSIMETSMETSAANPIFSDRVKTSASDLSASVWKALAVQNPAMPLSAMAALMERGHLAGALSAWSPLIGQPPSLVPASGVIRCDSCGVTFQKAESFKVHRLSYCTGRDAAAVERISPRDKSTPAAARAGSSPTTPSSPLQLKYSCRMCHTKFMSQDTLAAHQSFYCSAAPAGTSTREAPPPGDPALRGSDNPVPTADCRWKCPCCFVVSHTAMAAQKHLETHNNVRAFKCSMCGYKGNTLRGMRTHIRMHFSENKSVEMSEESFISCIVANSDDEEMVGGGRDSKTEKCPLCAFRSSSSDTMFKHFALVHSEAASAGGLSSISPRGVGDSGPPSALSALRLSEKCPLCSFYTDAPDIMAQHQALRHGRLIVAESKRLLITDKPAQDLSSVPPASCNSRGDETASGQRLKETESGSAGSNSAAAVVVAAVQGSKDACETASASEQQQQRAIRCSHCDISFKQSASFEAHVQFYCPGRIGSASRSLTPVQ